MVAVSVHGLRRSAVTSLPFSLALVMALAAPALAIDCTRATTKVEQAICADAGLRRADEQFNRNFARLLESLDRQQRRTLIAAQRRWLKQRDTGCAGGNDIVACVADAIRQREKGDRPGAFRRIRLRFGPALLHQTDAAAGRQDARHRRPGGGWQ